MTEQEKVLLKEAAAHNFYDFYLKKFASAMLAKEILKLTKSVKDN